MLKGCQKKIIFLKDTESNLFEEAYFVIKPEFQNKSEEDIIAEATKIANGGFVEKKLSKRNRGALGFFLFSLGVFVGSIIFALAILIFG